MKSIGVYCSSSDAVDGAYRAAAEALGESIGRAGYSLVYGGTNVGLMGALAMAARDAGARVVGVVPEFFRDKNIAWHDADELIFAADMRERKATMERRADAFIALPGGFGTLEEIAEILVLKQLHQHDKPVVFLNTGGYYDPLLAFFERLYAEHFTKPEYKKTYFVAPDAGAALEHIATYAPPRIGDKWFR
jgi:uncharacterized protein (TIGR00730 family)